jgi:hypothetical protein
LKIVDNFDVILVLEKFKLFSKILVGWNFGNGEVKQRPVS